MTDLPSAAGDVPVGANVVAVGAGYRHMCVITSNLKVSLQGMLLPLSICGGLASQVMSSHLPDAIPFSLHFSSVVLERIETMPWVTQMHLPMSEMWPLPAHTVQLKLLLVYWQCQAVKGITA